MLLAFALGVMTFTPWEILLSRLSIVGYLKGNFWGIAWWTPLFFGLVTGVGFILFSLMDRIFRVQVAYNPNHLAYEYLQISGFFLAIIFLRPYPYFLILTLLFLILVRLIFFHGPLDLMYFILGACLGPTLELLWTSMGFYAFTEPDFLGMPYWLPFFWGNLFLALRRVSWILAPPPRPEPRYGVKFRHP